MIQCCEPFFFQCYLSTVGWYKLKASKSQEQKIKFFNTQKKPIKIVNFAQLFIVLNK